MKGDFTQFTFDELKHYTAVLKQQGRVDLDADWNEYVEIRDYLSRTEAKDVIGLCGVPQDSNGFRIDVVTPGQDDLTVSPGRIYVRGILCENDAERPVSLTNQDDLPGYELPAKSGVYLAYVDVWKRHITALEDPDVREVALSGPDTATRVRTIWQVKLEKVGGLADADDLECADFGVGPDWEPQGAGSTGVLGASCAAEDPGSDPCVIAPGGGYRGLENRLYRAEIHDPDTPTFKWSRDNGAVVFPVDGIEGDKVKLKRLGRDEVLTLHVGDWVEVLGDETELRGEPGTLAQIKPDGIDETEWVITLTLDVSKHKEESHLKVRRWDQKHLDAAPLQDGAVKTQADTWIPLEDGVQVYLKGGGTVQTGDYWLIPARTALRDVLWPRDGDDPVLETRHGIHHHYCILALLAFDSLEGTWTLLRDYRNPFPPLTKRCCTVVWPGEDVQQAIDTVVAAGGGCVRLCTGVHQVNGPLLLTGAHDVTLSGVNRSTVLVLNGTDAPGQGGIVLRKSARLSIENLFILGTDVSTLIDAGLTSDGEPCTDIALRRLDMLNPPQPAGMEVASCAVRIAEAEEVRIEDCRLVAMVGVLCLNSAHIEPAAIADMGVRSLHMQDVQVRYHGFGAWAVSAQDWQLESCDFVCLDALHWGNLALARAEAYDAFQRGDLSDACFRARLLEGFEVVMSERGSLRPVGTALKVFTWRSSTIRNCGLHGLRGMDAWFMILGTVTGNTVLALERGIHTFWLHDSRLRGNRIRLLGGVGISFVGSYRARIEANDIRAAVGVTNLGVVDAAGALIEYVTEVEHFHELDAVPILLWELVRLCNLLDLLHLLVQLFDAFSPSLQLGGVGTLITRVSRLIAEAYPGWAQRVVEEGVTPALGLPMPLVALALQDNDIASTERSVSLQDVLPLGGMKVADNRLHTESGQAIHIKAHALFVNPHVTIAAWHALLKYLIEGVIPHFREAFAESALSDEVKGASSNVMDYLEGKLELWAGQSEEFLEGDYRIESNSVRCQDTAIESNLFGLAILDNHITLLERSISNEDTIEMAQAMDENEFLQPMAVALREGSARRISKASIGLMWSESVLAGLQETGLSEALSCACSNITRDDQTSIVFERLARAVNDVELEAVRGLVPELLERLQRYASGYGIWVKGAGCRIMGNRVVVPADTEPDGWARGGIRVWDDEATPFGSPWDEPSLFPGKMAAMWTQNPAPMVQLVGFLLPVPYRDIDPLLGMTETLIDDNEIVRGVCHGVEIKGIDETKGLFDLKIRGNQIRGMAGAGILIGEEALVVGLDVEGNHISDCSTREALAVLTDPDPKGGLVIRNAGQCRIHNNRISHCGNLLEGLSVNAIDSEAVCGLTLTDNHVLHAGRHNYDNRAAIWLFDVDGQLSIHDNDVVVLRGDGIGVDGVNTGEGTLQFVDPLKALLIAYAGSALPKVELNFSCNHIETSADQAMVVISNIGWGVIASNLLDGLYVYRMHGGVMTGNACRMILLYSSPIVHQANIPEPDVF